MQTLTFDCDGRCRPRLPDERKKKAVLGARAGATGQAQESMTVASIDWHYACYMGRGFSHR